ncbi:PhoU domain-containing protein [Chloroflexota bacterium]
MTSEIIKMMRGTSLIKKALREFISMTGNCEYLYDEAWSVLRTQDVIEKIPQYFYDRDIMVNEQEKEIRRLLFEHLSVNPLHDLSGALALMSLVKDAERIGDYSKNLFETGVLYKGTIKNIKFFGRLTETQQAIAVNFPKLKKAFEESDEEIAQEILKKYTPIKRECDVLLYELFKEEEISTNEAIITGLLTRYLKRINSHVSNIASGIVYPLNEIDFVRGDILE